MTKAVNFALRLPPDVKEAARALTGVHLYRPSRCGREGRVSGVSTSSINEALVSLMIEGLEPMLAYVDQALNEENAELAGWQEIVKRFIEDPLVGRIFSDDFEEGSAAWRHIDSWQDYSGTEEEPIGLGLESAKAARGFAFSQEKVLKLTGAKGAILKVLAPLEARAKETDEDRSARIRRELAERKEAIERERLEREREAESKKSPALSVVS
jgi:hypothetical protein